MQTEETSRWCARPARDPSKGSGLSRYLRLISPVTDGPLVIALFVGVFVVAGQWGGSGGLLLASGWLLFMGTYCTLNFWHCRETHCVVTGPGWTAAALLGFAAVIPGLAIGWYDVGVQILAAMVALGVGYGLEGLVALRTGRRVLR